MEIHGMDIHPATERQRLSATGRQMSNCRICGNGRDNRLHYPREMMFGRDERFEYLECADCGCLQLTQIPENLADYYPAQYYSYREPKKKRLAPFLARLRALRTRAYLGEPGPIGSMLALLSRRPGHFEWLARGNVRLDSRILDVGCGSGGLLLKLQREGFRNLLGADVFIERDLDYGNGVRILRQPIEALQGPFDFVMLHHSFEHMPDSLATLRELRAIVAPGGTLLVRIPVADSHARRKYGLNWVAWDAPRHLYLHTVNSLHLVAAASGFAVDEVTYDSSRSQFVGSELYLRGITFQEQSLHHAGKAKALFSATQWDDFEREAERLNALRDGDTACFYLKPK